MNRTAQKDFIQIIKKEEDEAPKAEGYVEQGSGSLYLFGEFDKALAVFTRRGELEENFDDIKRVDCIAGDDQPVRIVGVIVEEM